MIKMGEKIEDKVFLVPALRFNSESDFGVFWNHGFYAVPAENKVHAVLILMKHPLYCENRGLGPDVFDFRSGTVTQVPLSDFPYARPRAILFA